MASHAWGGYGGGHAVPRYSAGGYPGSAPYRHPRPGTGSGGYYGHGHGYGYGYGHGYGYGYGHGYGHYGYGHGYYGHYPYYGYYPYYGGYYPYGLGLSLGFYYGSGYAAPYYGSYAAPYYAGDATPYYGGYATPYYGQGQSDDSYSVGGREPDEGYSDPGEPREAIPSETGELRLLVRPDDAVVYVDGEFRGVARRLVSVRLAPGRHRVEVTRPGFRTAERDVDVQPDRPTSLQIELGRP
jgi:hypothetical protein